MLQISDKIFDKLNTWVLSELYFLVSVAYATKE